MTEEYAKDGTLSDKTYADLEAKGFPRGVVDAYIAGQKALADQHVAAVYEMAGGEEQLNAALEWASTNLPSEQVDSFNTAMEGTDSDKQELAIRRLMEQYSAANPKQFKPVQGKSSSGATGSEAGYANDSEMHAAMMDPRYLPGPGQDKAYVAEVQRKIAAMK